MYLRIIKYGIALMSWLSLHSISQQWCLFTVWIRPMSICGISAYVSYRCQWGISIWSQRFTYSKHALGRGGIERHRDRESVGREEGEVLPVSLLWHCECQTPITLIREGICMIKRIRDFNQKNSLVWKRDTLRQARPIPPPTSDKPISPTPSVTASASLVVASHEYAWANQE